jgi:hypothetical protein
MTVRSSFSVNYPIDRTVIAAQDVLDQLGWSILEMSTSRMVVVLPGLTPVQLVNFPKMSIELREEAGVTDLAITVTVVGGTLGSRNKIVGSIGRFTNSLSLRIQTDSVAINPTVALGDGQGPIGAQAPAGPSRVQQLKDLKELLDSGVLNQDEFNAEKARILDS